MFWAKYSKVDFLLDEAVKYTKHLNVIFILYFTLLLLLLFLLLIFSFHSNESVSWEESGDWFSCMQNALCAPAQWNRHRFKTFSIECYRTWFDASFSSSCSSSYSFEVNAFVWLISLKFLRLNNEFILLYPLILTNSNKAFPISISGSIPISVHKVSHFHFRSIISCMHFCPFCVVRIIFIWIMMTDVTHINTRVTLWKERVTGVFG